MDNSTAPSLSPQGLDGVRKSLLALNSACSQLISILDRSPEQVSSQTAGIVNKYFKAENIIEVDVILNMMRNMNQHLNHILTALDTHTLYDNSYKATNRNTGTLVEALQESRDALSKKRRENGFLENTFKDPLDAIGGKIQNIYQKIPLYTQKTA